MQLGRLKWGADALTPRASRASPGPAATHLKDARSAKPPGPAGMGPVERQEPRQQSAREAAPRVSCRSQLPRCVCCLWHPPSCFGRLL